MFPTPEGGNFTAHLGKANIAKNTTEKSPLNIQTIRVFGGLGLLKEKYICDIEILHFIW